MPKTTKVTYARHGAAVACAGAVIGILTAIGLDLGEEVTDALIAVFVGLFSATGFATYAFIEKFLKRFTGEDEEEEA